MLAAHVMCSRVWHRAIPAARERLKRGLDGSALERSQVGSVLRMRSRCGARRHDHGGPLKHPAPAQLPAASRTPQPARHCRRWARQRAVCRRGFVPPRGSRLGRRHATVPTGAAVGDAHLGRMALRIHRCEARPAVHIVTLESSISYSRNALPASVHASRVRGYNACAYRAALELVLCSHAPARRAAAHVAVKCPFSCLATVVPHTLFKLRRRTPAHMLAYLPHRRPY